MRSVGPHLPRQTGQIRLVPMLDELAVGDTPDFDITPTEFLSGGLEYRCIRAKLNRVAVRCREVRRATTLSPSIIRSSTCTCMSGNVSKYPRSVACVPASPCPARPLC